MATSILLRRQFSPSSLSSKRAISAFASLFSSKQQQPSLSPSSSSPFSTLKTVDFAAKRSESTHVCGCSRGVHSRSGCLDFRASFASQAGFAVADYSDDDKVKGSDEGLEISKLNVHPEVISCLSQRGITKLFPIQKAVLEPAMQGRDMIGRARTGTGKTLAFGIPILDKITRHNAKNGVGRDPLALVLAPTRELARQVEKEFHESSKLDTLCVYGGTPISKQMNELSKGVDVVAGTPGRIIDLLKRGALDLSSVQFVVLDEADQMLNVGFEEDVELILQKLPLKRQTMMFSATMPNWIMKLTRKYLKDPLMIDLVGDSNQKLADGISLCSVVVDHHSKAGVVGPLVTEHAKGGKTIVFTQTKRDADNLASAMGRKNYKCEPLHGDIAQNQRERTLKRFRDGDINILVATDVAARGLDIPNVDLILHYELPSTSESFVHRSGRTGRAGKKGIAIVIHTMNETRAVKVIERDVGCQFKQLPAVASDGTEMEMGGGRGYGGGSGGGRFGGGGGYGGGFGGGGRSGGYGNSSGGRSGGYGNMNSGRSGGSRESGFGQRGGYDAGSNTFGRSGFGRPSGGGFGDSGRTDRSSGFGNFGSGRNQRSSGRFGSFGDDGF